MLARPAGWTLDGVYEVAIIYARHGGHARDGDRVQNLVFDALKGIAWRDDNDARVRSGGFGRLDGDGSDLDIRARRRFKYAHDSWTQHDEQRLHALPDGHTLVTVTQIGDGAKKRRAA